MICDEGVVIFGARNCNLSGMVLPFWNSGERFQQLGAHGGAKRAAEGTPWDLESDFQRSGMDFGTPFQTRSQYRRLKLVFCFCACFQVLFLKIFWSESGRTGFEKHAFGVKGSVTTNFSLLSEHVDFKSTFC